MHAVDSAWIRARLFNLWLRWWFLKYHVRFLIYRAINRDISHESDGINSLPLSK